MYLSKDTLKVASFNQDMGTTQIDSQEIRTEHVHTEEY